MQWDNWRENIEEKIRYLKGATGIMIGDYVKVKQDVILFNKKAAGMVGRVIKIDRGFVDMILINFNGIEVFVDFLDLEDERIAYHFNRRLVIT